jgi:hypothetical protein
MSRLIWSTEAAAMSRRPRQPVLLALAKLDERKSWLVELRYFGGLTSDEAAEVLGISPRSADREWEMAVCGFFACCRAEKAGLSPAGSSGRAVKHFGETNSRNRPRVSDYLAIARRRVANEIWM